MTREEHEAIVYEKFKKKKERLTEFVHYKRIFSRMEAQKRKETENRKAAAVKK